MTESLWDWSLRVYIGDVPDILIDLQDAHGQNVPLLLWAAWCASRGASFGETRQVAIQWAITWETVIVPLRTVRRQLKGMGRDVLRSKVKAAELAAEKVLLELLSCLKTVEAPRPDWPANVRAAAMLTTLLSVSTAWSPGCPCEKLVRLTQALSET